MTNALQIATIGGICCVGYALFALGTAALIWSAAKWKGRE